MIKYDHLLGKPFKHGEQDCYTIVRDFYKDNFDITLAQYARPDFWWERGHDLYIVGARQEGFEVIHVSPQELHIGDIFLMAIEARVANHAAIYVGDNHIIHHFYNRLSNKEQYKGLWRRATVATIRHPDVKVEQQREPYDLMNDPRIARRFRDGKLVA